MHGMHTDMKREQNKIWKLDYCYKCSLKTQPLHRTFCFKSHLNLSEMLRQQNEVSFLIRAEISSSLQHANWIWG